MTEEPPIVVVGAGISGLSAARRIEAAGCRVVVLEKSSTPGGRMATRHLNRARADTGAQFFTVRSKEFAGLADRWLASDLAYEWCRGFEQPPAQPDGYPRYAGRGGMAALAESMASGLDGRYTVRVTAIGPDGAVTLDDNTAIRSRALVLTPPAPQSLVLLDAGGTPLPGAARTALDAIVIEPTVAIVARLDQPSAVPPPGGVQLDDGAFSFVADNQAKGISEVPAVTLHAAGRLSEARWGDPDPVLLADLLREARRWLGRDPIEVELVRWRYARPIVLHPQRCLVVDAASGPLVFAGDAFGEARIEGAVRSGWAAADELLARLG
jgi:renalase